MWMSNVWKYFEWYVLGSLVGGGGGVSLCFDFDVRWFFLKFWFFFLIKLENYIWLWSSIL